MTPASAPGPHQAGGKAPSSPAGLYRRYPLQVPPNPALPPAASVPNVPPQRDARTAPGWLRGQRSGRSARRGLGAGGSRRLRKGERKGRRGWVRRGAARLRDRQEGAAPSPALSAEDGSDESSRGGHFLLGWMRRSRRRRGGDRTEDGPCGGEVSPGLATRFLWAEPPASAWTASLRSGPPGEPRTNPAGPPPVRGAGEGGGPAAEGRRGSRQCSCSGSAELRGHGVREARP